jgi:hypothetical protein
MAFGWFLHKAGPKLGKRSAGWHAFGLSTYGPQVMRMLLQQIVHNLWINFLLLRCNLIDFANFVLYGHKILPTMKSQLSQLP